MDNNLSVTQFLQPGTSLKGGQYVIEKKIGEGGFSITYKARQSNLKRFVCIKEFFPAGGCVRNTQGLTVHPQGYSDELFKKCRDSFVEEARTVAKLHHPNIVDVIDIFDENNTSYMVMPFIEGYTLEEIVANNGHPRPLSYPEAVNFIGQIADAVGYIHSKHYLHRDIKPDNIIITANSKAILIDFGSAREYEENKTMAFTSLITPCYSPSEQYTRNSRKGAYSDIYSLGATLYYITTGVVPVEAAARLTVEMPTPKNLNPSLPDEADRTIMKAMQLKSQNRHQSIAEFMDDLRNIKPSKPVRNRLNKKQILIIFSAVIAFLLAVGICILLLKENTNEKSNSLPALQENRYERALNMMKSTQIDTLLSGYYIMDSLSQKNYIPAMTEMVFTIGWYSDPESLRRKDVLGIEYELNDGSKKYLPLDNEVNLKAISIMSSILEIGDSNYAKENVEAAYRLAGYYASGVSIKKNRDIAKELLIDAQEWAKLYGDENVLNKINDVIEKFN